MFFNDNANPFEPLSSQLRVQRKAVFYSLVPQNIQNHTHPLYGDNHYTILRYFESVFHALLYMFSLCVPLKQNTPNHWRSRKSPCGVSPLPPPEKAAQPFRRETPFLLDPLLLVRSPQDAHYYCCNTNDRFSCVLVNTQSHHRKEKHLLHHLGTHFSTFFAWEHKRESGIYVGRRCVGDDHRCISLLPIAAG